MGQVVGGIRCKVAEGEHVGELVKNRGEVIHKDQPQHTLLMIQAFCITLAGMSNLLGIKFLLSAGNCAPVLDGRGG